MSQAMAVVDVVQVMCQALDRLWLRNGPVAAQVLSRKSQVGKLRSSVIDAPGESEPMLVVFDHAKRAVQFCARSLMQCIQVR